MGEDGVQGGYGGREKNRGRRGWGTEAGYKNRFLSRNSTAEVKAGVDEVVYARYKLWDDSDEMKKGEEENRMR